MRDVLAGNWKLNDHIMLGEGRATIALLKIVATSGAIGRNILLSLEDNMAWGGASSKGRSSCPSLSYLCRKKAAYCIAKGIRLELPWVQSGAMPADGLSRL